MYELAPDVVSVRYLKDYELEVSFANGECGIFDVSEYLKYEFMAELKDKSAFAKATVDHGTVVWPTGQDLCPESVYAGTQHAGAVDTAA